MYKTIKPIFKINIFLLIVTIIIICSCMTGCKTPEYLNGTIALGYRNNTYYLITSSHETFSLADYDDVKPVFGDYLMVQKKNKWGFIEKSGKQITKIKYDTVNPMDEDKAVVTLNGKTLIIDSKDQVIYTFSDNITSYSSFKDNILVIEKDGLFGYLKYDGHNFTILAEPQYNYAGSYKGGYAVVGMRDANKVLKYSDGMRISYITSEKFYEESHRYIYDIIDVVSKGKENIILDQFLLPFNLFRVDNYFDDRLKAIVVERDPRDVFIINKYIWQKKQICVPFPLDVNEFCSFYKKMRESEKECNSNKVLRIRFEDLIYNYDDEVKRITKFLGFTSKDHINKKSRFDPDISIKNTQLFRKKEYQEESKIIERELEKYLYNFPYEINNDVKETVEFE